jgi:hypothetical protein
MAGALLKAHLPSLLLEVASLQGLALVQQLEQEVWVHVLWEAQVLQR